METKNEFSLCVRGACAWTVLVLLCILGVILLIYLIYKFVQGPNYCKKNRINGKVVIITGCDRGIGKETALELARRGGRIYMACCDEVRCETARLDIIERTGNPNIFNRKLDLASLASVRRFVAEFLEEESQLDILINNAGVLGMPHTLTIDGYEHTFAVNHLGHFLLTNLLLERLKKSAPSRIVVLSSVVYKYGRIKRDDLNSIKKYSKLGAYAQSKLATVLFTRKLAQILKKTQVTVNCCHPGVVRTGITRNFNWLDCVRSVVEFFSLFWMKNARSGAQTTLRLALDPSLEKSTGGYYADTIRFPIVPWVGSQESMDWMWQESERMVKLNTNDGTTKISIY